MSINKDFATHVSILKKDGKEILDSLNKHELSGLVNKLYDIKLSGDELDQHKKLVMYGKKDAQINFTRIFKCTQIDDYFDKLTPEKCDLLHMTVGVVGESSELSEAVINHIAFNKELDIENISEEIGDTLFYLFGIANTLGLDIEIIMRENIEKLSKRYPQGYSDKSAQERLDKKDK